MSLRCDASRAMLLVCITVAATSCDEPSQALAPIEQAAAVVPGSCLGPSTRIEVFTDCVTLDGVRAHQAALQSIADANGSTRATANAGHTASVQYVVSQLSAAGYQVTLQPFDITGYVQMGPSILEQTAPVATTYTERVDYSLMSFSAPGDVTAEVSPVDLAFGPSSTSGCEAADFVGFPSGNIALMERGACTFALKATNAAAAGASGAIIFNRDQPGLINGTLTSAYAGGIPVAGTTYDLGVEWAATPGLIMRLKADVFTGTFTTHNVLAETVEGDPGNVVVVGGHLDSVNDGPGINDNGSGVATMLEVAIQMAGVKTRNKVRFAFWSAHELGLLGSAHYVNNLSPSELNAIALYLDVQMIGSPNFGRFVLDGDGSSSAFAGPAGSGAIEAFFNDFYATRGHASEPSPLDGRSDYQHFMNAGVPIGAIFSGADRTKTAAQAALYGGTAGDQFDPCFHLACDTYANVSTAALDLNSDAIAAAVLTWAMNTESINAIKGKGRFKPKKQSAPVPMQAVY